MSIGTCLSPWIWSVKRSPQLIWPHEQVFQAFAWTLNVPDSGLVLVLQGGFYSLRPHGAWGRIKDWWELSESVYCSRDPRLCYEWVDCVAVLPQFMRLAQQRSVWQSRLDCFFPSLSLSFLAQSIASLWIAGALKVANSTVYSGVKCDEILVLSGRKAFTFPPTHAFSLTSKFIRVTLTHYCR